MTTSQIKSGERQEAMGDRFETMPLVVVKYCGLQEGFAQLAPRALFNVVGGDVPDLIRSTVTLESLTVKGYRIKECRAVTSAATGDKS
jgi:hypothetical protein